jgi:glycosyltransferase involved in cell wall biosynthesis
MAHRNVLMRWAARQALHGADAVVANSPETAALVARLGAQALVVPPGIDLDRFTPQDRPAAKRVLYLGGDLPHKGIDIARGLADTLVGPGIREVDPGEIPALMGSHSVVLIPSLAEPFGLAAVEAIASGRWVVARAVGGLIDIVSDGVNGSLVADGDFARALVSVPDYEPATVAATARRFSIDEHRRRMAKIWSAVLDSRGITAG